MLCILFIFGSCLAACESGGDSGTSDTTAAQSQTTATTAAETDAQTEAPQSAAIEGITSYKTEIDTMYVTWLNVWYGSTESWFGNVPADQNDRLKSSSYVYTVFGSTKKLLDANNAGMRNYVFNYCKGAGVQALVMDLTNGYTGWGAACLHYEKLCFENYMYFTVATHPKTAGDLEDICRVIYQHYIQNAWGDCFLYKDGKPMIVLYCTDVEWKNSALGTLGEFSSKFNFSWASGEDSASDKWGWQLDPTIGPVPSSDSMFLTSSTVWNSPSVNDDSWRKSLAMLDFCFLAQRQAQPAYTIVGSIDDPCERNNWIVADTSSDKVINGLKMKDVFGNVSEDVYYNRVRDWINGGAEAFVPGGLIPDGAYTVTGTVSGDMFGVRRPTAGKADDIGSGFIRGKYLSSKMETYYWFYHVGNNYYRIVKLSSGLSLTSSDGFLTQNWDEADDAQFWLLTQSSDGSFTFTNKATGQKLTDAEKAGGKLTLSEGGSAWTLTPVVNRQIQK